MLRIFFVCTGNTCRSPMAAFLAQSKIRERGLDWRAESAGLYAVAGMQMTPAAALALKQHQIEETDHESKSVMRIHIEQADLVLAMTAHHAWELRRRFPEYAGKIQQLGGFVEEIPSEPDPQYDIVDPYGGSDEMYSQTAWQLGKAIDTLLDKLQRSSGAN